MESSLVGTVVDALWWRVDLDDSQNQFLYARDLENFTIFLSHRTRRRRLVVAQWLVNGGTDGADIANFPRKNEILPLVFPLKIL